MQAELARLGIAGSVYWAGFLHGEKKWAALCDAEIFVLPSYSENFGIAVLEALAAGTPVVISDQVGVQCEIARAEAGLVAPCEVATIAAAISKLLDTPSLCERIGGNAQRLAREKFSAEAVSRKLIQAYRCILQGFPP